MWEGSFVASPPVYDPGPTLLLRRFEDAKDLVAAVAHARAARAAQIVAPAGDPALLVAAGFSVASDWWTGAPPLEESAATATEDDLDRLVAWGAQRRAAYERVLPVFWHPAADAEAKHRPYLRHLIESDHATVVVCDEGFLVAERLRTGEVQIDDFVVDRTELWDTAGRALLRSVGGRPLTVICARHDEPKRALLASEGFTIRNSWHVLTL
ncbi:MAG: hypothetical protein OER88_01625 [Planctomycetota bacterium]|nr:hypothetical protein [Planctomycetota bacterium]